MYQCALFSKVLSREQRKILLYQNRYQIQWMLQGCVPRFEGDLHSIMKSEKQRLQESSGVFKYSSENVSDQSRSMTESHQRTFMWLFKNFIFTSYSVRKM